MNLALPKASRPVLRLPVWRVSKFTHKRLALIALAWIVGAVAFAGGLLQTKLFAVDRIDVTGNSHLSREDVLSIAKLKTGGSIARVNASQDEHRLEQHPWVLHARVDVHWPHVVAVSIVEQRAVAVAQTSQKKWAQLGPDGTVLAVTDKPVDKLPAAVNVSAPGEVGKMVDNSARNLMTVATLMPASLQPHVVQMQEQNGVLRLGLDAGTVVILGDANDLSEKLVSAASVIFHTDPKTLVELDVTSPRFPVAQPKGQTATVPAAPATTTNTTAKSKSSTSATTSTTTKSAKTTTTSVTVPPL